MIHNHRSPVAARCVALLLNLLAASGASGQDAGITPRPLRLTLPSELPGGWKISGMDAHNRHPVLMGAFYLPDLGFRLTATSTFRQTDPDGLWAFLESFIVTASAGDFEGVLNTFTPRAREAMMTMLADPAIRTQWEQIHRAITWIDPLLVVAQDDGSWMVNAKLDGPPWAAASYRIVWHAPASAWRFEPRPFSPELNVLSGLVKAQGIALLEPTYDFDPAALNAPPPEATPAPVADVAAPSPAAGDETRAAAPAAPAQPATALAFDEATPSFSLDPASDLHQLALPFTNHDSVPVVIQKVALSCGCMSGKTTREVLQPGESASLEFSYRPGDEHGQVLKHVGLSYLRGEETEVRNLDTAVILNLPAWVQASTKIVYWKPADQMGEKMLELRFASPALELKAVESDNPAFAIRTERDAEQPGLYRVHITPPAGPGNAKLTLRTNQESRRLQLHAVSMLPAAAKS